MIPLPFVLPSLAAEPEQLWAEVLIVNQCDAEPAQRVLVDHDGPDLDAVARSLEALPRAEVETHPSLLTPLGERATLEIGSELSVLDISVDVHESDAVDVLEVAVGRRNAWGDRQVDRFSVPVRSGDLHAFPLHLSAACEGRVVMFVSTLWGDGATLLDSLAESREAAREAAGDMSRHERRREARRVLASSPVTHLLLD